MDGMASWYGGYHAGHKTANGEYFNPEAMTASHKTLPFNSLVRVISLSTGKTVIVRINDRGPYPPGRIIDLSHAAAKHLGIDGINHVHLEIIR